MKAFTVMIQNVIDYYARNPNQITLHFVLFLFVVYLLFVNGRRVKQIITAKDKEIERLADDNRKYREIYLTKVKGLSVKDYNAISSVPIEETTLSGGQK